MKNTLTRTQLIKAQKAFECEAWVNPIQKILDSSDDETIEIEDKYLDLIKKDATWGQITFCKALNLDLKMNLPQEAKDFVLERLKACELIKLNEFISWYQENGKTSFYLNSKYKEFLFSDEIYIILRNKYLLNINEIIELMISILVKDLKLNGFVSYVIPILYGSSNDIGKSF